MSKPNVLLRPLALGKALRGSLGISHYLFAAIFLLRLIALTRLASSAALFPSDGDMHFYDDWARKIAQGHLTDHLAFYGLPLYAYCLGLIYKLFGYSPFIPGLIQACFEAGTGVLIYQLLVRTFRGNGGPTWNDRATGILAALGWAFFVPAQAYSVILMPTAAGVFVFWLLVWEVTKTHLAPSLVRAIVYGALIGIAATGIATILFVIPLLLAAVLFKPLRSESGQPPWLSRGMAILLFVVGIVAGSAPCWIHNYFIARDPVFLSAHGGINFWLGNNPNASGYPRFPGIRSAQAAMLQDSIDLAEAAVGHSLKRSEVSRYWTTKAVDYIKSDFVGWLKLIAQKIANFWNAFEYDDLGVIADLRARAIILPGLHFGVVAAFAIPGFFWGVWAWPRARWIAAAVLLQMLSVLPVFVTERYRLPAAPGLLIFAAAGLAFIAKECSLGRYRAIAGYTVFLILATTFVSWPRTDPALWAMRYYSSGRLALQSGDLALADRDLVRAHVLAPDNAETTFALANLRWAQGNRRAAQSLYESVLQSSPRHKGALNNLALLALEQGDAARAALLVQASLRLTPDDARAHYVLARAELAQGHKPEALAEIDRALKISPSQREFLQFRETIVAK